MKLSEAIYNEKPEIKNIIFDLGGVIIDLHIDATIKAFEAIGIPKFDEFFHHLALQSIFIPFETGKLSPAGFRNKLRKYISPGIQDTQIDDAWNAMLGELPELRWNLLKSLGKHYRLFLLSNTNEIHRQYYYKLIQRKFNTFGFDDLFEKVYLSFELGMRKPDAGIFEHVLKSNNLNPLETFFIDDFEENIHTAKNLGIKGWQLKDPHTLLNLFDNGTDKT